MKIPGSYNPKLEKKYFYLPRICRQLNSNSKDIFKSSSVRIIPIFIIIIFKNRKNSFSKNYSKKKIKYQKVTKN